MIKEMNLKTILKHTEKNTSYEMNRLWFRYQWSMIIDNYKDIYLEP